MGEGRVLLAALAVVVVAGCSGQFPNGFVLTASPTAEAASMWTPRATSTSSATLTAAAAATTAPMTTKPAPVTAGPATVAVSVATVWRSPSAPRAVDAPALANPPAVRAWLARMTLSQRRALNGRADTQALLGERVVVLSVARGWAHLVVPDQPTPRNRRGYPGWVPVRQLVAGAPKGVGLSVEVTTPTTWLRRTSGRRSLEVSFGTRLSALGRTGAYLRVRLPTGVQALVAASDVTTGSLPATSPPVTATARRFLGLPYLWGGLSGFGLDCSGLTHLVYRVHGVRIPRDADDQAVAGRPVTRRHLRPGDLVFFAASGSVDHVGMYVGRGRMLHAPRTGSRIQVTALSAAPWASEYAGGRRFLR